MQGLKPDADWIGFIGPTKVVPLLQSLWSGDIGEFFRSLYCRLLLGSGGGAGVVMVMIVFGNHVGLGAQVAAMAGAAGYRLV